jgi:hypothetical protein
MVSSPLLRLPREIRNHIYHYTFTGDHVIHPSIEGHIQLQMRDEKGCIRAIHAGVSGLLGLPRTSRQLRNETKDLVFQLNRVWCLWPSQTIHEIHPTVRPAIHVLHVTENGRSILLWKTLSLLPNLKKVVIVTFGKVETGKMLEDLAAIALEASGMSLRFEQTLQRFE